MMQETEDTECGLSLSSTCCSTKDLVLEAHLKTATVEEGEQKISFEVGT